AGAADHDQSRLALGVPDLRAGRIGVVAVVELELPQPAGRARFGEPGRARNHPWPWPERPNQSATGRGTDRGAVGHVAALAQYVGDHVAYFTYVYCLWIFLTWLTKYLIDVRHFTLLKGGLLASLPLWAGVVGDTVGGLATDWLLRRTGNAKLARSAVAITGLLGCAVFIVPAALTEDPYVAVGGLTASMFFLECTIGPSWAVPMDTGGKYSGTVSG